MMSVPSSYLGLMSSYLAAIEAEAREILTSSGPPYIDYFDMLHYHMGWLDADLRPSSTQAGKRIRPLLCLLACEAAEGSFERAVPAAVGLELIHNFSLVHDDIEDKSDTRRGRPTLWTLWGQPQAINAGDGLFSLACLAFTRLPQRGVPVDRAFNAFQAFIATCLALTQGQHLDLQFEDRLDVTVGQYLTMIEGKTAALISVSAYLGAYLAGVNAECANHYRAFGHHLGMAFQIRDDILGIWGDAETTGKSVSTDIETKKKTLPAVFGLEHSSTLRAWYAQDVIHNDQVCKVVQILDELGARAVAEELAAEHHEQALDALERSGAAGAAGAALRELAVDLLNRSA